VVELPLRGPLGPVRLRSLRRVPPTGSYSLQSGPYVASAAESTRVFFSSFVWRARAR
jgi:hypothetical protein